MLEATSFITEMNKLSKYILMAQRATQASQPRINTAPAPTA